MLESIGEALKVHDKKRPQYGNTLAAFFRAVMEYAEANPESDLALTVRLKMEEIMRRRKRPYRRGLLKVLTGIARKVAIPRAWLDLTVEEAHTEALKMEASRLIREARRGKRRKRL